MFVCGSISVTPWWTLMNFILWHILIGFISSWDVLSFLGKTVDGTNPAPVEVGCLSHYLQGFIHPRWLFGISSIKGMLKSHESLWATEMLCLAGPQLCELSSGLADWRLEQGPPGCLSQGMSRQYAYYSKKKTERWRGRRPQATASGTTTTTTP